MEANKVNSANEEKHTSNDSNVKKPFDLKAFVISFFTFFTVEPYIMLNFVSQLCVGTAIANLYLEKACRLELNHTKEVCLKVIMGNRENAFTVEAMKNSSILVSNLKAWKDPIQTAIPAIFVLFIGAWSDKTGNRKALLLVPLVGDILTIGGYLFSVYFMLQWPLWVFGFIEILFTIFTGGFSVVIMGALSYLADVTTKENRTFRIGVFMVCVQVAAIAGLPIAGYILKYTGYHGILGVAMAGHIFNFIYTLLRIRNVRNEEIKGTFWYKVKEFFHPRNIWETVSILFMSRGIKLAQILLAILAYMCLFGPSAGEGSVTQHYMLNIYGMDIIAYNLYSTISRVVSILGISIVATVFSKWWQLQDAIVGIIVTASNVFSSVIYGFAPNIWYFAAGNIVDIFGGAGTAVVKSLATKVVKPNEVGKVCALFGLVEMITPTIYLALFNKIFSLTLKTDFPGSAFILGAVLTFPNFAVFMVLTSGEDDGPTGRPYPSVSTSRLPELDNLDTSTAA